MLVRAVCSKNCNEVVMLTENKLAFAICQGHREKTLPLFYFLFLLFCLFIHFIAIKNKYYFFSFILLRGSLGGFFFLFYVILVR